MKSITILLAALCAATFSFATPSENQKLIELGKLYRDFMFRNEAKKTDLKTATADIPEGMKPAAEFIEETIKSSNKILSKKYLTRPDDNTLKQIYIINAVCMTSKTETAIDKNHLVDSLSGKNIPVHEMVDNYYDMLLTSEINKNQASNIHKFDFVLKDYKLNDEVEAGILVLHVLNFCNRQIWGYMNIVKPANTKEAFAQIKKFPRVNGRPYFQYTDFSFPDFEMVIDAEKGMQSYKSFYLNRFYELLLMHLICLNKEGGSEKETYDLMLGSIMKERSLYKYTKYSDVLEDMFKEQKTD